MDLQVRFEGGATLVCVGLILCVLIAFMCRQLAKQKGRCITKFTILGAFPLVNVFIFWFLVGDHHLLDKKLDKIITLVEKDIRT